MSINKIPLESILPNIKLFQFNVNIIKVTGSEMSIMLYDAKDDNNQDNVL